MKTAAFHKFETNSPSNCDAHLITAIFKYILALSNENKELRERYGAGMKIMEAVFDLLIRIVVGCTLIYFVNIVMQEYGYQNYIVGINEVTVGTVGLLGVPGVMLLYGIVMLV